MTHARQDVWRVHDGGICGGLEPGLHSSLPKSRSAACVLAQAADNMIRGVQ